MAALQRPVAVGRNEGDGSDRRPFDRLDDHVGRNLGEAAKATFLPRCHEAAHAAVVLDRRARACEREPPARALPAAGHRPRGRRPATLAERRLNPGKARPAAATELAAGEGADRAPLRQQQVEHAFTVGSVGAQVCAGFVADSAPARSGVESCLGRVFGPLGQTVASAKEIVGFQQLVAVADVHPEAVERVAVDGNTRDEPFHEPPGRIR